MGVMDVVLIAAGYLSGSIPFGLIFFKLFKKDDIRKYGSGNIGATNVARSGGVGIGLATFVMDILKGMIPILVAIAMSESLTEWTPALVAMAAVAGHMFPVWLKFSGGKGVATAAGALIVLSWQNILIALIVLLVTFYFSRIVSLSSILAALTVAVAAFVLGPYFGMPFSLQIASLVIVTLIIFKHHENIKRLINGTEKRLTFGKAEKKEG